MKLQINKIALGVLSFLLISFNVLADDTELYVGGTNLGKVRTNVTFIVDTSGSMEELMSMKIQ